MDDSRQSERASEMSLGRPTLSSKPSLGQEFAREPDCGVCKKAFNLLRRRHHCRGCHVAICKDCGKKAIDHRKGENSKPQWYCITCTDEDPSIEVVGVSRNTITSKRMSFSSLSMSQGPSSVSFLSPK
jgi:C4-type Zn-finger protein